VTFPTLRRHFSREINWYVPCETSFPISIRGEEAMPHAIEMLLEDHHKVKNLFEEFKHAEQKHAKEQIVENTLRELEVHATLEEEIFLPGCREANR
jgi:hypothetical protein